MAKKKEKKLGLRGMDVNLAITKVGNRTETFKRKMYNVPLIDRKGWYEERLHNKKQLLIVFPIFF